jgi:hypothetical protein
MVKTSIGALKLSPLKEDGRFVFYNDIITINGKISKGDRIDLLVEGYEIIANTYYIKKGNAAKAIVIVRGEKHEYTDAGEHATVEDLYRYVSELYKTNYYFARKE